MKHMYENFKKAYRDLEYKKHLWFAVSAGTEARFKFHMEELKKLNANAYQQAIKHDTVTWARYRFSSHAKSDAI